MNRRLVLSLILLSITSSFFSYLYLLYPPHPSLTVIMVGFGSQDEQGGWQGEISPYLTKLRNVQNVTAKIPLCSYAFLGTISDQQVLVTATGMAKTKTSACTTNLLNVFGRQIKEVILSGIAGFSDPAVIGDICINSTAFDFDLQHYSSDQKNTSLPNPQFWSFSTPYPASVTFGSQKLAKELLTASLSNQNYRSWGPDRCIEATGDLFWHDTRADLRARELGAKIINTSPDSLIIASSMEAVPISSVITWWNSAYKTTIAFAYVRSASNYNHPLQNSNNIPGLDGQSSLAANGISELAIKNQALPVLKMLELRSKILTQNQQ